MVRLLTSAAAAAVIGISTVSFAQDPKTPNRTPSPQPSDQQMRSRDQPPESYQQPTEDLSSMRPKKSSKSPKSPATTKDPTSTRGGSSATSK